MKHIILLLFTGLLINTLSSCKDKDLTRGLLEQCSVVATRQIINMEDTLVVCDVAAVKESFTLPLSQLVDSFEVVQLENTDGALMKSGPTTISNNYIGIHNFNDTPYKLFNRKGKFIRDIGSFGQGPGEYQMLYDDQIDEKNDRIYLLPWTTRKILVYDLKGNYLNEIPLPYMVSKGQIFVDTSHKQVSIINISFNNTDNPVAWLQDFEGNIIHVIKASYLQQEPDYSNEITSNKSGNSKIGDFYISPVLPTVDSLYYYHSSENRFHPVFTATYGSDIIPVHFLYEFSKYYMVELLGQSTDPNYTMSPDKRIIVDKETLKGGYCKIEIDQLGGIPFKGFVSFFRYGYFVENIEPTILLEQIKAKLADSTQLSAIEKEQLNNLKKKYIR